MALCVFFLAAWGFSGGGYSDGMACYSLALNVGIYLAPFTIWKVALLNKLLTVF